MWIPSSGLTNSLDLNGCGLGVEDPYLPPAAGTNVAVGANHERTLQEEGRECEGVLGVLRRFRGLKVSLVGF